MTNEKCEYYDKGFCQKGLEGTKCELNGCVAHIEKESTTSIWHDSNKEQPESLKTVAIWNPKIMDGEILSRCAEVYPDRLWAYMDDLLNLSNIERSGKNCKEESVSEDLEDEIESYMKTNLKWNADALREPIENWGVKIARHFANWQKYQDKQWIAENHKKIFHAGYEEGFETGRDDMEEQMMKEAAEGYIDAFPYADGIKVLFGGKHLDVISKFHVGDKVKLIIIKEE